MRKTILQVAAITSCLQWGVAQQPFFQPTTYRGAFDPAPTPMWTDQWCEWDPQNKMYSAPTMTVTGNIINQYHLEHRSSYFIKRSNFCKKQRSTHYSARCDYSRR